MQQQPVPTTVAVDGLIRTILAVLVAEVRTRMDVVPARIAQTSGQVVQVRLGRRPVIYLDTECAPIDQAWGIIQAARVVELGPENVPSARRVRHLRSVS